MLLLAWGPPSWEGPRGPLRPRVRLVQRDGDHEGPSLQFALLREGGQRAPSAKGELYRVGPWGLPGSVGNYKRYIYTQNDLLV